MSCGGAAPGGPDLDRKQGGRGAAGGGSRHPVRRHTNREAPPLPVVAKCHRRRTCSPRCAGSAASTGGFRPDVVLSTGGFVSVPAVVAARGIAPVLTHEQTAILGLANRINARFADTLAVSHRQTEFRGTATPSRRRDRKSHPRRSRQPATARAVCAALDSDDGCRLSMSPAGRGRQSDQSTIAALLPGILDQAQIVHQTGPLSANADASNLLQLRETLPETVRHRTVVEFLRDELPDVYAAADLVVGRAGAGTIAELAYVGLPAILVPLPGRAVMSRR